MLSSNTATDLKKNLFLSAVGFSLQAAGTVCIAAAAVGIGKEINQRIHAAIIKELMKQGSAE